jgi:putative sugar O-methyltransferase
MTGAGGAVRAFEARVEASRQSAAFRNYRYVRDKVLQMRADVADGVGRVARSGPGDPSAYWEEELSNFEYMLDASPLVVDKLRHHSFHITGLYLHQYRTHRDRQRSRMAKKLRALLRQSKPELLVPEWPGLGGFGFDIDGSLFNLDTLKFFEVLTALEKGAVLDEFRGSGERRLVWEIGAGWGGFPYQFKTVCPNTTYMISDFPELFLFSATYLMTAFPDAKVFFWGDDSAQRLFANWRDYDFIFVPNTALNDLAPDRLDLTVNMVSFQEMTTEQVTAYVERAHALGCRFLYSLNREKSGYNPEIESVSRIIDRYYWPRDVSVLPVSYQKMLDEETSPNDYKHVIGWRRIVTT